MGFLRNIRSIARAIFGTEIQREITIIGNLPEPLGVAIKEAWPAHIEPANITASLETTLGETPDCVAVGVFCIGTRERFLVDLAETGAGTHLISSSEWWRLPSTRVRFLAFSCFSAELVKDAGIAEVVHDVTAYSGKIWLDMRGVLLQVSLLQALRKTLRGNVNSVAEVYADLQSVYVRAIKGEGIFSRFEHDIVSQLCLVQQSEALRVLPGGSL